MGENDIFLAIGKFDAEITGLKSSVDRLESSVARLTEALDETKGGWKVVVGLASLSSLAGALAHKPLETLLGLLK